MQGASETANSFFQLMGSFQDSHSPLEIFLCYWNFIGSLIICFLSFWNIHDLGQKEISATFIEKFLIKMANVLIICGCFYHAIKIETPDWKEGLILSGVLLYMLVRRVSYIKQKSRF